ncbi:MAG: four helix bundle protein, partial [Flavobacterium sp.]|nr:four helix bundle protein [Flavobacterium sp.]
SFSYFLDVAKGSLNEIETQLIISKELEFVKDESLYDELMLMIQEESKMIYSFSKTLKN